MLERQEMEGSLNSVIVEFENGSCKKPYPTISVPRSSWVYIWVEDKSKHVVYVGETSQNIVTRLRRSIGELVHNTLGQVQNNAKLTGLDLKQKLLVYAYPLIHDQQMPTRHVKQQRRSTEAWVHWLICVQLRKHHNQYCGFKYNLPEPRDKQNAELIIHDLAKHCGWGNVSL